MSTQAQVTANQTNAQKSTGPKTEQGKAIASQNNFRFGFTGTFRVLAWENEVEFQILLDTLHAEHQPSTPTETVLVDKMAQSLWLSKRAVLLQDLTMDIAAPLCENPKQLALYLRYQATHDRAFRNALTDLLKLRAETRKQQIGFESQQRHQNDEGRKEANHLRREAAENRKQERHRWDILLAEAKVDHQQLLNLDIRHAPTLASLRENPAITAEEAA